MFETGSYKFEIPKHHKSIIKVIGVGGGGSNAVNHMYRQGIKDVEFVVCNTDAQALNSSPVPYKLQIGTNLTEGLGCGANPEVGRAAAVESKDQIREMLTGTKMVFVTAGMGGGTGTGAAPVIAKIAKDMDILTVGIVTAPFAFEGKKKSGQAESGIEALRVSCDTVLVILNDKLREIYGNLPIGQAFGEADNILTTAAKGIAEIITLTGYVNVDFQDVRTVMLNAGAAVMGSSETRGDDRAKKAAELALASPLLDNKDIMGAKRILLSIISGEDAELQMDELSQITEYIQEQAGDEAEVIFGHGVDPAIGDRIRVTVIATGFAHDGKVNQKEEEKKVHDLDRSQISLFEAADNSVNQGGQEIELKIKEPVSPAKEKDKDKPVLTPTFAKASAGEPFSAKVTEGPNTAPETTAGKPSSVETTAGKPEERGPVKIEDKPIAKPEEKPVSRKPAEKRKEEPPKPPKEEKSYTFTLFEKEEVTPPQENTPIADDGEESLFLSDEDDFGIGKEIAADQIVNEEGLMELRKTKERLEQQAKARREKLKAYKKQEMTKEEFNEKWTLPAYLRRGVKMDNVPHSSEPFISRYNLNDDNNLLGNNKFLHDNVD